MNDNNSLNFNEMEADSSSGNSPGSSTENSNIIFRTEGLNKGKTLLGSDVPSEYKCPICLAEMKDPTALSDCIHLFCFDCIQEWLNMKPECPLCKQSPNDLKHFLRIGSNDKLSYALHGEQLNVQTLRATYEMGFILPQTITVPFEERKAVQSVIEKLRKEITLLKSALFTTSGRRITYLKAIQELEDERQMYSDLDNMFAICSRRDIFSQPAFRRIVYSERLYVQSIVPPRCNVVFSTDYIKKHMSMVKNQLLPFIIRDLAILKDNQAIDADVYIEKIMEYLTDKICRTSILQFFKDRGVRGAVMFINNLKHFLTTGQTLEVYDQNSTYTARWLRGLDFDNDVEFLGGNNNDVLVLDNDEIHLLNSINRAGPPSRRRRRLNQRGPISDIVNLVSSSDDDSDVEVEENMSGVRLIQHFKNKNPRNLEKMCLQRKPTGWVFEKNRDKRNCIYSIEIIFGKSNTSASISHFKDGLIISASTTEKPVSLQLYSNSDVCAAYNIGKLLGERCKMAGILNCKCVSPAEGEEKSLRRIEFFKAIKEAGIKLEEQETLQHTHLNDPNLIWEPFPVRHSRETKLDELDLTMKPGKGVC